MLSESHRVVRRVQAAIHAYLNLHPGAADNAEGIQKWWLPPSMAATALADVQEALTALHDAGVLSELRLPDGSVLYSVARRT